MGVSNELAKPETDEEFEVMCHALYRRMWNDTGCVRMGGSGQAQFGVDILGHDGKFTVSVDFWGELSGHIRLHPEIGRAYIPDC